MMHGVIFLAFDFAMMYGVIFLAFNFAMMHGVIFLAFNFSMHGVIFLAFNFAMMHGVVFPFITLAFTMYVTKHALLIHAFPLSFAAIHLLWFLAAYQDVLLFARMTRIGHFLSRITGKRTV